MAERVGGLEALRAAATLTTGAVASSVVAVNKGSRVTVYVDFTIGSLTNVILRPEVRPLSGSGSSWYQLTDSAGDVVAYTLTASDALAIQLPDHGGEFSAGDLRLTAQGTGTVTGSSLTLGATVSV